jgi:PAS domain S-box-containing protein
MSASASLDPESDRGFTARNLKFGLLALICVTALVWLSSRALLSTNFLPHWYCLVGNKRLLWTTVIADLLIGLSYVAISTTLVWLVRRAGRDLPYSGFFWAFGLFIVSCGVTHFLEIVTVWKPVYWLSAAAKVVTAAASLGTAVVLIVAADDIVEFVRTAREAASQRGNERFRALIQATPMPVISSDLEGKMTAWNLAAERVFGWRAAEEVLGKAAEIVPEDNYQEGVDATILVADDESALRHAIVEILRGNGYKVLEAETSTQALEMARQHQDQLDILLTDIVMPGLRGPELARRVAKVHPEVQIVYMSGYAEGFPEAQLPANATFLQKPFRFATLLRQLKLVRRKV